MATINRCHSFTVELVKQHWIAQDVIEFSCTRPAGFTFVPGQFVRFTTNGTQRDYTLVSALEAPTLDFCLKIRSNGRFSKTLLEAPLGHSFHISGPHGHFTYRRSTTPSVLVATGVGIAPFVAFSRSGIGQAMLLHGVRTPENLIYQPIVQQGISSCIACISHEVGNQKSNGHLYFSGRVTDYLQTELPRGTYDFYLCGRSEMIRDATAIIDDRFEDSKLYFENFD